MPASAASNRPEDLAERLDGASGEGETLLKALREVKNQIIGNKTKKLLYLHLGAIPKIVSILASAVDSAGASAAPLIVQSAAALGSFASGLDACARAVLDAGAVPHLMRVLYNSDEKVVDAGARSLRMIFQSKLAPKYDVLQEKNMQFLLSLLNSVNENVIELAASIIMHSCETSTEQKALCDAGVLHRLFGLLDGSLNQRDASLDSIAVIVKNNCDVVSKFSCIGNGKALSAIIELVEDRYPRTRLLACVCLIAIGHASPWHMQESEVKMKLILILVELLEEPGRPGDEAPFALADLIADKDLHEHAISVNAVEKLCNFLHKSLIEAKRLQGILLALAELCSKLEKCRCQIMLMQVLKLIVDALMHDCADVRIAACTCIKSISRSVKNLSAGRLSGESIVLPLIQLLHDPSTSVQVAALCAFCNVVVDFTPQKFIFFQHGCVKELVHLSNSTDSRLKLNAIWALRNLMFLADRISKEGILLELTELTLASLICDQEPFVQEQALGLVRNLVDGHIGSVEHVFAKDGIVIDAVARQVRFSSTPEVCIQGMFVLSNIASGNEFHKELVMSYLLPPQADRPAFIIKFLQNNNSLLRTASIWCIVNLTYPDCPGSIVRVTRLRDAGIMFQVKTMVNDPCLDVKYRVRMALEQCLIFEHSGV